MYSLNEVRNINDFKGYILELKYKRLIQKKDCSLPMIIHIIYSLGVPLANKGILKKQELMHIAYKDNKWISI